MKYQFLTYRFTSIKAVLIPCDFPSQRDCTRLEKLNLSDLEAMLKAISYSAKAKDEAARIAQRIRFTFELNSKWNWAAISYYNQKAKGYYCYEWAYAFQDAMRYESSGQYFTVQVSAFGDLDSGKVHAFTTITSLETGISLFIDDGFTGRGYVHTKMPIGGIYTTPMQLVAELAAKNCDIPRVITEQEYNRYWERFTAAMDVLVRREVWNGEVRFV